MLPFLRVPVHALMYVIWRTYSGLYFFLKLSKVFIWSWAQNKYIIVDPFELEISGKILGQSGC